MIEEMLNNVSATSLKNYAENQIKLAQKAMTDWVQMVGKRELIQIRDKAGWKESIECDVIDLTSSQYDQTFENAPFYRKSIVIQARQAKTPEIVIHRNDQADVIANIGDWVIHSPAESEPYVIKNEEFAALYVPIDEQANNFISVGRPVKAVKTNKNVAFLSPWAQLQVIKAGGYLLDNNQGERYGVPEDVFEKTYQQINDIPMRFIDHSGKHNETRCKLVDLKSSVYSDLFDASPFFIKHSLVYARQASTLEIIETPLDATQNTASPGDWIVNNPGERPYIIRASKFFQLYRPLPDTKGVFLSAGKPIKAVQIHEDVVFFAPWGELQAVKANGWIIQGINQERYGIDSASFSNTYKPVSHLKLTFKHTNGFDATIDCRIVDLHSSHFNKSFENAELYHKQVEVKAHQIDRIEVIVSEDDASSVTANPGDWIVTPEADKPYVIKQSQFPRLYQPKENEKGVFISLGRPVKAIPADENICFLAPWGEMQGVQAGGRLLTNADGERYGISASDFARFYVPYTS